MRLVSQAEPLVFLSDDEGRAQGGGRMKGKKEPRNMVQTKVWPQETGCARGSNGGWGGAVVSVPWSVPQSMKHRALQDGIGFLFNT